MNELFSDNGHPAPDVGIPSGQGPASMEIDAEAAKRIETVLAAFVDDVQLDFAAVLDDSGAVLGWMAASAEGDQVRSGCNGNAATAEVVVECSGALAMGAFAAAQTLAAQLGGEASREMIHHAGSKSFHLTEISRGTALFSVWSDAVALGYLRDCAARVVDVLRPEIADLAAASSPSKVSEGEPWQSPLIDFPSSPMAASGGAEKGFPMTVSTRQSGAKDDRYVFEIG